MQRMKKVLQFSSSSLLNYRRLTPGILSYSSKTQISYTSPAAPASNDTLYARISQNPNPKLSIVPIIDNWVDEGQQIDKQELIKIIRELRKYRRFKHALEVSEWMSKIEYFDVAPGDVAVRLDLISKVRGIDQAEVYFNTIPNTMQVSHVYGALLDAYVDAKSMEKAESVMEKLSTMDSVTTLTYNAMLNLYSHLGKQEKLDSLTREMEEKGISYNRYTYSILLNAFATSGDINQMEKLLMKMETDPLVSMSLHAYVIAAKGYQKIDDLPKALSFLKKGEQLIENHERKFGYEVLLTMYGNMGKKNEVYRLWDLLKRVGNLPNTSYLSMLSSLEKLGDLDGAEKILKEWEESRALFDIRVPNFLICAFCDKGLVEKAESIVKRLMDGGKELNGGTWSRMALGYCKCGEMEKAVEMMRKAISCSYPGWKPHFPTFGSCMEYMRRNGDKEKAEEMLKSLERCRLSAGSKKRLFWYLENGYDSPTIESNESAGKRMLC